MHIRTALLSTVCAFALALPAIAEEVKPVVAPLVKEAPKPASDTVVIDKPITAPGLEPESKPAPSGEIAQKKADAAKQMTQESVPLGGGRFLLIDGGPGVYENVYGFDIIKVVDGIPRREPLFMQEFDAESRNMALSDGVAVSAMNYAFDRNDNTLVYTSRSADGAMRYRYKYTLVTDMFILDEVIGQEYCADASCKSKTPQVIFKSAAAPAAPAPAPAKAAEVKPAEKKPEPVAAAEKAPEKPAAAKAPIITPVVSEKSPSTTPAIVIPSAGEKTIPEKAATDNAKKN